MLEKSEVDASEDSGLDVAEEVGRDAAEDDRELESSELDGSNLLEVSEAVAVVENNVVDDDKLRLSELDVAIALETEVEEEDTTGQPTEFSVVTSLVLRVIAPPSAKRPPTVVAPLFTVTETCARTCPANVVATPSVTLEPTCQKTLPDSAPPVKTTEDPTDVISVEPIMKYHVSSQLPVP